MPVKIGAFKVINVDEGEPAKPCGECNACCTVLEVKDGDFFKPANTVCQHLTDKGCGIYSTKPELCSKYYCMYAIMPDMFQERDRPDKVGILISMTNAESHFGKATGMPLFAAYEIKPNASQSIYGERIIRKFAKKVIVAIIPFDKMGQSQGLIDESTRFIAPNKYRGTLNKYLTLFHRAVKTKRKEDGTNNSGN
jgi:hypothetical protein